MKKVIKFIKQKLGKGFTFMIVPNSPGSIKSCSIPFSAALVIIGIIVFNLYIFIGFTTQIFKIHHFRAEIREKTQRIAKLEQEQREVKPTLQRSYQIAEELSKLKIEREKLLSTWKAIQLKGGRVVTQTSRGALVRPRPYILSQPKKEVKDTVKTSLSELNDNLNQIDDFVTNESESQKKLLAELLAYERKLDHTPSIWPVRSYITSWFGNRFHPTYRTYKDHTGLDIAASYGSRVNAAADGVVEYSGYRGGYGYTIIINHGYGYKTFYAHNSRLLVNAGQQVKKGQKICLSGNSGTSTGPHLHYEVRVNNVPVNPMLFFRN